jgi:hypothetical protein
MFLFATRIECDQHSVTLHCVVWPVCLSVSPSVCVCASEPPYLEVGQVRSSEIGRTPHYLGHGSCESVEDLFRSSNKWLGQGGVGVGRKGEVREDEKVREGEVEGEEGREEEKDGGRGREAVPGILNPSLGSDEETSMEVGWLVGLRNRRWRAR